MQEQASKSTWQRIQTAAAALAMAGAFALGAGCTSGFHPAFAAITASGCADFPYRLTLHTNEVINFNAHALAFEHNEQDHIAYFFLKRRVGELHDGDFAFGVSPESPDLDPRDLKIRGTIKLTTDQVTVRIEQSPNNDGMWVPFIPNFTYRITDANKS